MTGGGGLAPIGLAPVVLGFAVVVAGIACATVGTVRRRRLPQGPVGAGGPGEPSGAEARRRALGLSVLGWVLQLLGALVLLGSALLLAGPD